MDAFKIPRLVSSQKEIVMQRLIAGALVVAALAAAPVTPGVAQAQGRNRYSPYIMTANGPMLRSQYMLQTMQFVDPTMIMLMQQQEQAYLNKGKKPAATTATKPTAKPAAKK